METRAGGPTVAVVEPQIEPAQAVNVALPEATAYAVPKLVASSVMLTAAGFDELHVTEASCSVLLSLNVPVAIMRCAVSRGIVGVLGATEMETKFGGVSVAGSYSSALAMGGVFPEILRVEPPATSTKPLSSNVAVAFVCATFMLPVRLKVPEAGS